MTILVDVDGVCVDLCGEWLRLYNEDYDDSLEKSAITQWEMTPFVKPACGVNIYKYLNKPDLYDNVEPINGALQGIRMLRAAGHKVTYLSTSPYGNMMKSKMDCLERHGFLELGGVIMVTKHEDKGMVQGDVLIDDYPENLNVFSGRKLLFDQPYNQDCNYMRALSWRDVPILVECVPATIV